MIGDNRMVCHLKRKKKLEATSAMISGMMGIA